MTASWTIITQTTASWSSVTEGGDDWIDPRTTLLLTEDGAFLRAADDGFITTEAVSTIPSPWVPL